MQVSVENVGRLTRKLTVRVAADRLESQVKARLHEMSQKMRLKGFRPGKIPAKVIEQRYGGQVRGEELSELIRASFQEAVVQQKLRPAMAPSIATSGVSNGGEIEYTATFEVLPEFDRIDVAQLALTRQVAEVTEQDVETMIDTLRQQRRTWAPVDRAATTGDMVLFEYSAEDGALRHPATGMDRVGSILGSGAMSKELEDELAGHKLGDEFVCEVTFPADFRVAEMAGRSAQISVHIMRVQESKLPDLDEAFAATFGVTQGGLKQFRDDVRGNLARELKSTLTARLKNETVEKLVEAHRDLELPQGMIEAESRAMQRQAEAQARQSGQPLDGVPSAEALAPMAAKRVAAAVLLGEIARQNKIQVDPRRVSEMLTTIASTYEEPAKVVELYTRDPQLMSGLQSRVMEDQVVEWIAANAAVSEQKLGFSEVMRP